LFRRWASNNALPGRRLPKEVRFRHRWPYIARVFNLGVGPIRNLQNENLVSPPFLHDSFPPSLHLELSSFLNLVETVFIFLNGIDKGLKIRDRFGTCQDWSRLPLSLSIFLYSFVFFWSHNGPPINCFVTFISFDEEAGSISTKKVLVTAPDWKFFFHLVILSNHNFTFARSVSIL